MTTYNLWTRVATMLLIPLFCTTEAWAGDVTAEQARRQAQAFLKSHQPAAGGPRRAPGTTPELTLTSRVSGLYVFNVADEGGFVIVSNDDRTRPILGFGDSGHIDPDHMPSNMRAWLQGYADEIAWLQKQGNNSNTNTTSTTTVGPAKVQRRVGSHSTNEITPMVSTTWNQNGPYWNQTPYYKEDDNGLLFFSKDYVDGYTHCATGCVATAMAQVMKYHEWPKTATEEIFPYQWAGSIYLPDKNTSLEPITFDWANMKDSYSGTYTDTEANAVATLMKYCGYSVEMDYGKESGSSTDKVADALMFYFDYNENTVTTVQRCFYTYANWTDLIYHELANGRPVVYGGMSSGGGHEFVCDGYQYDSDTETDFFHINWGWGGKSDNYFVLSALDPDIQGIGGSTSNDGFHYGQDAVIGIQPAGGTGTIADIPTVNVDLALNSVTFSDNPIPDEEVTVYIDLKNNSTDEWDGDIGMYVYYYADDNWEYLENHDGNFLIPAQSESTVCQLTFTPHNIGQYGIMVYRPSETLGYINWIGSNSEPISVMVMPLGYLYPPQKLTATPTPTSATITWTGNNDAISYNVRYRTPSSAPVLFFEGFENSGTGWTNSGDIYTGIPHSGTSFVLLGYSSTNTQYLISPELTNLESGSTVAFYQRYYASENTFKVGFSSTTTDVGAFSWGSEQTATSTYTLFSEAIPDGTKYIAIQTTAASSDEALLIDDFSVYGTEIPAGEWVNESTIETSIELTGLTPETTYEVQAQAVYTEGESEWTESVTFTTPVANSVPADVTAHLAADGATITWTGYGDSYNFQYRTAAIEDILFFEDFENGLYTWTAIRNGEGVDGTDWRIVKPSSIFSNASLPAHSGNYAVMTRSYSGEAYEVDNWLISPQVTLDGTLKFWVMGNASYPEHYDVYVSTTSNDISAFTKIYEPANVTDTWTEVSVDLSSYNGKRGYIALRHTDTDKDYLLLDDFGIYTNTSTPASDWQEMVLTDPTVTLSGLPTNNGYEYRIQSVTGTTQSEWSETGSFALLTLENTATTNSNLIFNQRGRLAHVTLANRTLWKDGDWNTLVLPFGVDLKDDGCPLAGATARWLASANITGTTLSLNFSSPMNRLAAGTPYIIKWDASENNIVNPVFNGVTINYHQNNLDNEAENDERVRFIGTYDAQTIDNENQSILYMGSGNTLYYPSGEAATHINACRAYFKIGEDDAASVRALSSFIFSEDDTEATGIISVDGGQTNIDHSADAWYTLSGVRLSGKPTQRGLYIQGGKKVLVP